uniref:hypothetical protein n=1 Tax=Cumulibacter manganitolerans TaxID=1884992 RepID=UPI001E62A2F9
EAVGGPRHAAPEEGEPAAGPRHAAPEDAEAPAAPDAAPRAATEVRQTPVLERRSDVKGSYGNPELSKYTKRG